MGRNSRLRAGRRTGTGHREDQPLARSLAAYAAPRSAQGLVEGWAGPGGYRLRLARPGDQDAVAALTETTGTMADPILLDAIATGVAGQLLRNSLSDPGGRLRAMASMITTSARATADGAGNWLPQAASVLVAADGEDDVVGVCIASAPRSLMDGLMDAGMDDRAVLSMLIAVVKIPVLAVAPAHQGHRVGRVLVQQMAHLHHHLKTFVVYGQYRTSEDLAGFYRRAGFAVLRPHEEIDLAFVADGIGGITPMPGEQLFVSRISGPLGHGS